MSKKLYYKIGEACRTVDIQPYVLRYWETEFSVLSPEKSKSGQRVYTEKELSVVRRIKELLYDEGYTIAGAKKRLESEISGSVGSAGSAERSSTEDGEGDGEPDMTSSEEGMLFEAEGEENGNESETVDTASNERIEKLRQGTQRALQEVRDLLALIDRSAAE